MFDRTSKVAKKLSTLPTFSEADSFKLTRCVINDVFFYKVMIYNVFGCLE